MRRIWGSSKKTSTTLQSFLPPPPPHTYQKDTPPLLECETGPGTESEPGHEPEESQNNTAQIND